MAGQGNISGPGFAAANRPDSCREFYWGKRLSCVEISLPDADEALVDSLLTDAWEQKQPHAK